MLSEKNKTKKQTKQPQPQSKNKKEIRHGTLIGSRNDFRSQTVCPQSKVKHVGQVVGTVFWMNHFGRHSHHHVMASSVDHLRTEVQQWAYLDRLAEEDVINVDDNRQALTRWHFRGETIKQMLATWTLEKTYFEKRTSKHMHWPIQVRRQVASENHQRFYWSDCDSRLKIASMLVFKKRYSDRFMFSQHDYLPPGGKQSSFSIWHRPSKRYSLVLYES